MGFLKKGKKTAVSVQTQGDLAPVLPVAAGERGLYRALREQVPIIDAAIFKLVRLVGGFQALCPDRRAEAALARFLQTVPVNGMNQGVDSFISTYFEQLLTYGNAVGEIVVADGAVRAARGTPRRSRISRSGSSRRSNRACSWCAARARSRAGTRS